MPVQLYDPDRWLVTAFRSLEDYVKANFELGVYEIQFHYPDTTEMRKGSPFQKTIIHFDVDNIITTIIGMGDNVFASEYVEITPNDDIRVADQEGGQHKIDLDIGVWASAQSGGATARLEALQALSHLFNGPEAQKRCMDATEGVDVLSFTGGRFLVDSINDLPVWRVVDMSMVVRLFSRRTIDPLQVIVGIEPAPGIDIEGVILVG